MSFQWNESVLVVDDDADVRSVLVSMVKDTGVSVLEAASGEEGLDIFRTKAVFLILSDYQMPGINGLEFAKACLSEGKKANFVLFTGHADKELVRESVRSGVDDVFDKPAELRRLRDFLEKKVEKRRLEIKSEEEEMVALRGVFCEEATGLFRDIDQVIFHLEANPQDAQTVDLLFRKAHPCLRTAVGCSQRQTHRSEPCAHGNTFDGC
jgi:CheY-like chemotaxis protein